MENRIKLNGFVSRISNILTDSTGNQFMFFDLGLSNKSYITIKIKQENLEKYFNDIKRGANVEIEGYLNTYIKENNKITNVFLSTLKVLDKKNNIFYTDKSGNEYWHGEKISKEEVSQEELEELEEMLRSYKEDDYGL